MMRSLAFLAGAVLLCATAACPATSATTADAGPPDAMPPGPATALFTVPRVGTTPEFYELPFPNDLRVNADGTLDLSQHVSPNALITEYFTAMSADFDGFGPNQASFARFSAPIDPATLPQTPADSLADTASVYLVNVDATSPDLGKKTPLRLRFEPRAGVAIGPDSLRALPYPGYTLRPRTTYALVITTRVRATDGTPVARSADFDLLAGTGGDDAAIAAARTVYAPLFAYLDQPGGDERADVASASLYTTGDPTALMGKLRDAADALPAPPLQNMTKTTSNNDFTVFEGKVDLPIFQAGSPPYLGMNDGGQIVVDATGTPQVQATQHVRVAVTVPTSGAVPAGGWPLVIYAHGTGGSYLSFTKDGTALRFAREGFAVLGIDQELNGTRYDTSGVDPGDSAVEAAFYNFNNPRAGRDNSRQDAADHFTLVRAAEVASIDEGMGGRVHTFDPSRFYFMGHSQGGITGPLFVAYEPKIRGAIFSGAGGLLYYALLLKTEPINIPDLLSTIIRDNPLDEFNNLLALVQMFIEPADPINYARLITREPPPGVQTKDVFQSQGFVDHYTPDPSIGALAVALGGNLVGPVLFPESGFDLDGRTTLTAPVTMNVGARTVVLLQYTAAQNSDGHFVVFDIPEARTQSVQFLKTLDTTGVATLVTP